MKDYTEYVPVDWTEALVPLSTGIRMAVCTIGPENGIPLMLLHGVTDSRISWCQLAPDMAEKGFRVYVPELRGHGKSDAPVPGSEGYTAQLHRDDILALMDALQLEKMHLVGHSLGSMTAQLINIKAPERVCSTTLIDSAVTCAESEVLKWVYNGSPEPFYDVVFEGIRSYADKDALPDDFIALWTDTPNESADFQAAVVAHARKMSCREWEYAMRGCNHFDNRADISKVSGKVLVIWGTEDTTFLQADQDALRAGLTGCEAVYFNVEGGSHNLHWDSEKTRKDIEEQIVKLVQSAA